MLPKVLIVEDDATIREIYALKFELEGFPIAVAENGQIGLEVAEKFGPEIILLDMMMPVMDGLEFMRQFAAKDSTDVIIFSNISAPKQMNDVMSLGASDYWVKSDYTPERVVSEINERWQRRASK